MSGVTYYTNRRQPELMWRVDAELALVEITRIDHISWVLSRMDVSHVEALLAKNDMKEVPAP